MAVVQRTQHLRFWVSILSVAVWVGVVCGAGFVRIHADDSVRRFAIPYTMREFPFRNVSLPWSERVQDLVGRLTLTEIQQQMGRGGAGPYGGPAPAISRLGVGPYQWDTECLRGDAEAPGRGATAFPQAIGLAAAFSPDLMRRIAEATGVETRGKHNNFVRNKTFLTHTGASCFSPVINVMRDPRWGRSQETYGEDPHLSGVYAASYVQGLQGNHSRYIRASAGCKHFDAYAGPENIPVSRMSFDAKVSERDWRMTFLPAFRKCVEAGTYSLMCSYNSINGVPACANSKLLTDILRKEWKFSGYVVSDQSAIENIINDHHYLHNSVDTVAACVNAGCNLELSPNLLTPVYFSLVQAVKQGKLSEATVRDRVSPLFYTRMRLGEFDPATLNPYSRLSNADVDTVAHQRLAVRAAMETFVLLKNDGSLPLKQRPASIGVVGPFARDKTEILGSYSPVPPAGRVVSGLEGLRDMATVTNFADGCPFTACTAIDREDVRRAVSNTDINFVLVGTGPSVEGEDRDRSHLELPGLQKQLVLDVMDFARGVPLVLVVFSGGPVNLSFAEASPQVSAVLQCFFPAQATGTALRHVLMNDAPPHSSPAARSPYTWPLYLSQVPPMVNYSMEGRTYRYFHGNALYPFGYGLSYSTFTYSDLKMALTVVAGKDLQGQVKVHNVGGVDAGEVVQVYLSWKDKSLPAPIRQLVWFDRVTILTGGSVGVKFTVAADALQLWGDQGWFTPTGAVTISVGGQQPGQTKRVPSNILIQTVTVVKSAPPA